MMDPIELKEIKDRLQKLEDKIDKIIGDNHSKSNYKRYTSSKSFSGQIASSSPNDLNRNRLVGFRK